MEIHTSYFGYLKKLRNATPIAICGKNPNWYIGKSYRKLAPKYDTWYKYNKGIYTPEQYTDEYYDLVLNKLNPNDVVKDLYELGGEKIALICYESPGNFCHRHLVSMWLSNNCNLNINEYN